MVDWSQFVNWAFFGTIGGCALYAVNILSGLKLSIDDLNKNVATLLERTSSHERRIERLENKGE